MRRQWWTLLVLPVFMHAFLEENELPLMLEECYSQAKTANKLTSGTQSECLQTYLVQTFGENARNRINLLDHKALNWVESLGEEVHLSLSRHKRGITSPPAVSTTPKPYSRTWWTGPRTTPKLTSRTWWTGLQRTRKPTSRTWWTGPRTTPKPTSRTWWTGLQRTRKLTSRTWWTRPRTTPKPSRTWWTGPRTKQKPTSRTWWLGQRKTPLPIPFKRRLRKEIRTLSKQEREEFFEAINALKEDTSVSPNKYDAIALLHQSDAIAAAHGGPNFVSWHRYYCYLFEEALRTKNPNVALPYWDSRPDFRMDNPVDSILFSDIFLGNPSGVVTSGPFANWNTPGYTPNINVPLRRGAPGPNSSLMDPKKLVEVWRQIFHYQILTPTAVTNNSNIEKHHNGVHAWLGGRDGHMNGQYTSPQDPAFFLLHCFVDYIWEIFRRGQRIRGIDSEGDFPFTDIEEQLPDTYMANLKPPQKNSVGYSNIFTKYIYTYAPAPRCSNSCGGASNIYLFCNRKTFSCQARSRQQFAAGGGLERLGLLAFSPMFDGAITASSTAPNILPRFPPGIIDDRTVTGRRKRSANFETTEELDIQNKIDGMVDDIASIRVGIVADNLITKDDNRITGIQQRQKPAISNVTIDAVGLSYDARYIQNVLLRNTPGSAETSTAVLIKKPTQEMSMAYIRAYNSNGSVCTPRCLKPGGTNSYITCTGALKVMDKYPLMYNHVGRPFEETKTFMVFQC